MAEFLPIKTFADLELQNEDEMVAGYRAGLRGDPEPGSTFSRGYWHGWRNGVVDGRWNSHPDAAQQQLAEEIVRKQRAH